MTHLLMIGMTEKIMIGNFIVGSFTSLRFDSKGQKLYANN